MPFYSWLRNSVKFKWMSIKSDSICLITFKEDIFISISILIRYTRTLFEKLFVFDYIYVLYKILLTPLLSGGEGGLLRTRSLENRSMLLMECLQAAEMCLTSFSFLEGRCLKKQVPHLTNFILPTFCELLHMNFF